MPSASDDVHPRPHSTLTDPSQLLTPLAVEVIATLWDSPSEWLLPHARARASYPDTKRNICDPPQEERQEEPLAWWLAESLLEKHERILAALEDAAESEYSEENAQRAYRARKRIALCRRNVVVVTKTSQQDDAADALPLALACEHRACPTCAIVRSLARADRAKAVAEPIAKRYRLTLATFTIPNCPGHRLSETMDRLIKAWRRLHGKHKGGATPLPEWDQVKGAAWSLEVTYNDEDDDWHPHIHALIDAPKLDPETMAQSWRTACNYAGIYHRSFWVDLRRVKPRGKTMEKAIVEATKYPYKPSALQVCPPHRLAEWVKQMHNRRCCDSWGTLKVAPLQEQRRGPAEYSKPKPLDKYLEMASPSRQADRLKRTIIADPILTAAALRTVSPAQLGPSFAKRSKTK